MFMAGVVVRLGGSEGNLASAARSAKPGQLLANRKPDLSDPEGGRDRHPGAGSVPQARHEQRQFLQVAGEVRRYGCVEHEANEGARPRLGPASFGEAQSST